jgi:hypothetical protein
VYRIITNHYNYLESLESLGIHGVTQNQQSPSKKSANLGKQDFQGKHSWFQAAESSRITGILWNHVEWTKSQNQLSSPCDGTSRHLCCSLSLCLSRLDVCVCMFIIVILSVSCFPLFLSRLLSLYIYDFMFVFVYSKSEYTIESVSVAVRPSVYTITLHNYIRLGWNFVHRTVSSTSRSSSKMRMIRREMAELSKKLSLFTRPSLRRGTGIFFQKKYFFQNYLKHIWIDSVFRADSEYDISFESNRSFCVLKKWVHSRIGQCVRPSGRLHDNFWKAHPIVMKFCA